jgi:hypothetical protein
LLSPLLPVLEALVDILLNLIAQILQVHDDAVACKRARVGDKWMIRGSKVSKREREGKREQKERGKERKREEKRGKEKERRER